MAWYVYIFITCILLFQTFISIRDGTSGD